MLHVEHGDEHAVVVPSLRIDPESQPGEQGRKGLHHEREGIPLVALVGPDGQNRAAVAVVVRIGRGVAILVDEPTRGHLFAPVPGQAYFTGGYGAAGHVQQHGALEVAGDGDTDGIGAQTPGPAAEGGYRFGTRSRIGGDHSDHAFVSGHRRVISQPADVALVMHRDRRDPIGLCLLDGHTHCAFGNHEAEPPVAVDYRRCGGFVDDLERSAGYDVAPVDAPHVIGNVYHAVGIVADQVGLHLVGGDDFRLFMGDALRPVDMVGHPVQVFGVKDWHGPGLLFADLYSSAVPWGPSCSEKILPADDVSLMEVRIGLSQIYDGFYEIDYYVHPKTDDCDRKDYVYYPRACVAHVELVDTKPTLEKCQ